MSHFINFNGQLLPHDQPVFTAASRAARFGDGIFETMRMKNGNLLFSEQHATRLFHGLELFQFELPPLFTWKFLHEEILKLTVRNNCGPHTRVRLLVARGEGGITDEPSNSPQFLIECWSIDDYSFNKEGMKVGVFEDGRKSMDKFSNVKSANYLPSVMASIYAKKNDLDECVFLNSEDRVCDATISNIFLIKDQKIFTPPLGEGCVEGVMRHHLLKTLPGLGYSVKEARCSIKDLDEADEIFLTNAVRGIRWVKVFRGVEFSNLTTSIIYTEALTPFL